MASTIWIPAFAGITGEESGMTAVENWNLQSGLRTILATRYSLLATLSSLFNQRTPPAAHSSLLSLLSYQSPCHEDVRASSCRPKWRGARWHLGGKPSDLAMERVTESDGGAGAAAKALRARSRAAA